LTKEKERKERAKRKEDENKEREKKLKKGKNGWEKLEREGEGMDPDLSPFYRWFPTTVATLKGQ
jgi:hypothetical protein